MEDREVLAVVEEARERERMEQSQAQKLQELRREAAERMEEMAQARRDCRHRENSRLLWRLLGCTVFGSLCVLQALYPALVRGLSFGGILSACCAAAVLVDRHVGRGER